MLSICSFFIYRYELLPIGGECGLKAQFPPQPRATPWVKMFVESNAL